LSGFKLEPQQVPPQYLVAFLSTAVTQFLTSDNNEEEVNQMLRFKASCRICLRHLRYTSPERGLLPAVCACSDIHADSEKNQVWIRERCTRSEEDAANDVFTIFIVPGDIGSEVDRIEAVLRNLVNNYDAVCYLPGTTVARCETL
jgi:hypothetical protein